MDRLDAMRVFVRVAESGSFSAVLRDHEPRSIAITAVRPGGRRLASKVRAFLVFLAESFATEPMLGAPR